MSTTKQIRYNKKKDGCWECTSHAKDSSGYPQFQRGDSKVLIYKYMYEKYKNKVPKGKLLRHLCNNKLCINPDHLKEGTVSENAIDREKDAKK